MKLKTKEIHKMERALRISAYRNIGFKDGKPWDERLVISNSLEKGELGDLLILVGPNNSGKTNVLDALTAFKNKKIKDRDISDLYFDEKCREPAISFSAKSDNKCEYAYKTTLSSGDEITCPDGKKGEKEYLYPSITSENIIPSLSELAEWQEKQPTLYESRWEEVSSFKPKSGINYISHNYKLYNYWVSGHHTQPTTDEELKSLILSIFSIMDEENNWWNCQGRNSIPANNCLFNEFHHYCSSKTSIPKSSLSDDINRKYKGKYGYDFLPKILTYENKDISGNDFRTNYSNIKKSDFFISLFNSIDFDISNISSAYDSFKKHNNKGFLTSLKKDINKKLEKIADKFNQLYFAEDDKYSFEMDFESELIYFIMFRGDKSIGLDYQSTGFRWFFNLFFNLLNSTKLNPGDIIIMDEPATNLHVKGQRELREFLKEFALKNDISVIIATHSPFLINLDNLDELRVIESKNNISTIENSFAAVNMYDPDSLRAVKESLTVENHILMNPENTVVFVEGITDYNYLTAFKKLFEIQDLYFLPINGVGKTETDRKKITAQILNTRKNPILLVDNDAAGKAMKEINKNNKDIEIFTLNEMVENCKEIEDLFSKDDLEKYNLNEKHASTSSVFKHNILKNKMAADISEITRNNFKKLFAKLTKELE